MQYEFTLGEKTELKKVYELIDQRIHWMDDVGIKQWNVTDYWECYPKSYYEKAVEQKHLYVLKRKKDGRIVGTAVLYEQDDRWKGREANAYYVHHLATELGEKGAGKAILQCCQKLAAEHQKAFLRLDCAIDNKKLNHYYDQLQFDYAGICIDGKYMGNRREKSIKKC